MLPYAFSSDLLVYCACGSMGLANLLCTVFRAERGKPYTAKMERSRLVCSSFCAERKSWSTLLKIPLCRRLNAPLAQRACVRLGLMDQRVRVLDQRAQVVGHVAAGDSAEAVVPGHADLVDGVLLDPQRLHSLGHERARLGGAALSLHRHPVAILDAQLAGQLGADLDKALWLQLGQPGYPAAHATGGQVLGQAVGGDQVRVARVGHAMVRVVRPREQLGGRAALLLGVERV